MPQLRPDAAKEITFLKKEREGICPGRSSEFGRQTGRMTKQALVETEQDKVLRTEPIIWPGDSGYNAASGHSAPSYLTPGQEGTLKDSLTGLKSPAGFVPQPWESNFLLEPYWSHQEPNGESLQRQERG